MKKRERDGKRLIEKEIREGGSMDHSGEGVTVRGDTLGSLF